MIESTIRLYSFKMKWASEDIEIEFTDEFIDGVGLYADFKVRTETKYKDQILEFVEENSDYIKEKLYNDPSLARIEKTDVGTRK